MNKILLVEDEHSVRLGLKHDLTAAGYRVVTAENGAIGIALIEREVFDLVVTDLRLPCVDGLEVLRRVKKSAPETGVIVITAFAEVKTAVEAIKEGAYDYLSKPFDPEELRLTIARFLHQRELELENCRLKEEVRQCRVFEEIVSASPAMEVIFEKISAAARPDLPVFIHGESGTGKGLVALAVHNLSPRKYKPFVMVNCAAIPETLIESELFGHEKGAFTGATARRRGKFEAAHGGTIFLDEIGDMPLPMQAKLLHVVENRTCERLGSNEQVRIDARIICATAKDLEQEKEAGRFRADLYYRLNVLPVTLPPLRHRREDILPLMHYFLKKMANKTDNHNLTVSTAAMRVLMAYDYPGNVRELKHALEMAMTFCKGGVIEPGDLPEAMGRSGELKKTKAQENLLSTDNNLPLPEKIKVFEKELIAQTLEAKGGSKRETARLLGVSRGTLWRKLKEHDFPCADNDQEE
ncbi:MAG: hypothetical protein A2505_05790 [Deltaproteobacteria bacterium RIFOXYD12_FULL_55_16]|nr:MAG: hypothetical protein A2505_05790 [Deltaproteobacteria bacterium RIFOXYD12_FULL_55_16]